MANKYMEMFSVVLVLREMQIETSVRYPSIPTRISVKITKPDNTKINKPAPTPSILWEYRLIQSP